MINEFETVEALYTYAENASSPLSATCHELAAYTQENVPMAVMLSGPIVASFLQFLIRIKDATRILEVGCYTGYSALAMAEALPESGKLVTLDIEEKTNAIAKKFWAKSPHGKKIESKLGDAKQIIPELNGTFDFIFIDADKPSYEVYLKLGLEKLSPKGIIVADNCLYSGEVLSPEKATPNGKAIHQFNQYIKSNSALSHVLLPIRDGLHLIARK